MITSTFFPEKPAILYSLLANKTTHLSDEKIKYAHEMKQSNGLKGVEKQICDR